MRSELRKTTRLATVSPDDHFVRTAERRFEKAKQLELEGRYGDAEAILKELAGSFKRRKLNAASCLTALGYSQMNQGRHDDAIRSLQDSLKYDKTLYQTNANLAAIYRTKEKWHHAYYYSDKALKIKPDGWEAMLAKGHACFNLRRYTEATQCFLLMLTIKADDWQALAGMALVFGHVGDIETTQSLYRRLLEMQPESSSARSNYLFQLHYDPSLTQAGLCAEHRKYGEFHEQAFKVNRARSSKTLSSDRKLRVGYVSADFRSHVVAFFTESVLQAHDRESFEVFCFSNSAKTDVVTEKFKESAYEFVPIHKETDDQVEQLVRDRDIDILVDLSGHTGGNRLTAFARKPAPIQASWCGYFDTTGLEAMDYLIVDRVVAPVEEARAWTESPLYLPDSYVCYQPPPKLPEIVPVPAETNGYITFGCFNNPSKINNGLVEMWRAVLEVVSHSKLLLQHYVYSDLLARERVDRIFREAGVPSSRYEYVVGGSNYKTLEAYNQVDITLDCLPYNGGTTTCESLWMGVPVVTLYGDRFVSRVGSSILTFSGLSGLIATTPVEYVERAATLAGNLEDLARLRAQLRTHLPQTPVFNPNTFVQGLENAYRRAFDHRRRQCA